MTGPTEALAAFGAGATTADLGDTILGWAVGYVLDNAAVALLGATQPVHRHARTALAGACGPGDSVVIGTSSTASLATAVFLNGSPSATSSTSTSAATPTPRRRRTWPRPTTPPGCSVPWPPGWPRNGCEGPEEAPHHG